PPAAKTLELEVVVPVEDMSHLGDAGADAVPDGSAAAAPPRASIWPAVEERVLDLVLTHSSTIVFANSRRLAERLCARLNERHADRLAALAVADGPGQQDSDVRGSGAGSEGGAARVVPAAVMGAAGQGRVDPAWPEVARAHHGSVSREQRQLI